MNLFKSRCIAFFIDCFIFTFFASLFAFCFPQFGKAIYSLYMVSFACKDLMFLGASPGKKVMKLSVVDLTGFSAKPTQLIIRNIPSYLLIGGEILQIKRGQPRIGDLLAGTMVVKNKVQS